MNAGYLWVVEARIEADIEPEWNSWYDTVHLPEIMTCPGFREATRLVHEREGTRVYLAIYEIDGPEAVQSETFNRIRGWGRFAGRVTASARLFATRINLSSTL